MPLPPTFAPVAPHLVGDNGPSVRPGEDPDLFGGAVLIGPDAVEVRSFQTFRIVYTVGRIGLDDTGGIRVGFRVVSDMGKPQVTDPEAPNYLTARCSGSGTIRLRVGPDGQRPWTLSVTAELNGSFLKEGETIELVFGDTSAGSPGMLMQTFAEGGFDFRVSADVQATGNFQPLPQQLSVPVIAGPAHRWIAVLPTLRRPGEPFHLGLKCEDLWGNPAVSAKGAVRLEPSMEVEGLTTTFDYAPEDRALTMEDLCVAEEGTLRIKVFVDGRAVAEAGPLVIRAGAVAGFWGDLHGQTGETVGVNTIESYFDFARNKAFLDVSAHQGNDFQINAAFWKRLNDVTAAANAPGRFTVLPGYEWSGNTAIGGDHNVFYAEEGQTIHRCSHALLEDRTDIGSDAPTLTDLYAALRDKDATVYAHVGGRYANLAYDHDPKLETAVEVHSAWGTFEWILTDAFALGRRVGVVANSDGHKGRPGASYPGASTFGAYGGLTCFLTDRNDRAAIIEAQRRRHHYATTGCRMHIDLEAHLPKGALVCTRDPVVAPDAQRIAQPTAMMGDIVEGASGTVDIALAIEAHAGIERVDLRNGATTLETLRPYETSELGHRIRVIWSGAEYRGRGRNTTWRGQARLHGGRLLHIAPINLWNPERTLEQRGSDAVVFDTVTTGNFMGFDAWIEAGTDATLRVETNHGTLDVALATLSREPVTMDAGGLARQIAVSRLPDTALPRRLSARRTVTLSDGTDDSLWIAVTTEDGYQAWTSPIYLI